MESQPRNQFDRSTNSVESSPDRGTKGIPAVIMAGGFGTRLQQLTRTIPKPMVPVAGRPALEHVLDHLETHGIQEAAMALHYLPHVVQNHFGNGREGGIRLRYSVPADDYGTAGGVRRAHGLLKRNDPRSVPSSVRRPVLVVSGDVLTDVNLNDLLDFHVENQSALTIALTEVKDASQYGVVQSDGEGRVVGFVEKPKSPPPGGCWVNAGIYVMDESALARIPEDDFCDISQNLIPALMEENLPVHAKRLGGYWFDIGTPQTLREAEAFFAAQSAAANRWRPWSFQPAYYAF